jgi:hypothetical protein
VVQRKTRHPANFDLIALLILSFLIWSKLLHVTSACYLSKALPLSPCITLLTVSGFSDSQVSAVPFPSGDTKKRSGRWPPASVSLAPPPRHLLALDSSAW